MPENSFEKNVQQRMDQLKLQPAESVWEKVYEKIRKEKKRRRFLVWFFLFALLLLGGGGWWLSRENKNRLRTNQDTVKNDFNISIEAKDHADTTSQNNEIPADAHVLTNTEKSNHETGKNKNGSGRVLKIPGKSKNEINGRFKKPGSRAEIEGNTIPVKDEVLKTIDPALSENAKQKAFDSASVVIPVNQTNSALPDSQEAARLDVPLQSIDSVQQLSSLQSKDKENMKKSNWEWSIAAGIGISNITNGIFEFFNDNRSAMADYTSSPGSGPSVPQAPQSPSSPTNGFSWELGVQAKRKLSNKIAFSAGLGFSSYSNLQKTGSFKDTTIIVNNGLNQIMADGIYRNGEAESFTNHFYFLQVPLYLHWQLNRGYKIPMTWQNGISFGQLINSDALFYNASSNIFYKDKDLLNKTQWIYRTVFSAGLFNKTNHPVTAGLQFNYHLRSFQKQKPGATNHLTSLGAQLGWIINK